MAMASASRPLLGACEADGRLCMGSVEAVISQAERPPLAMTAGERRGGGVGSAYWRTSSSGPLIDDVERLRAEAAGRRWSAAGLGWAAGPER